MEDPTGGYRECPAQEDAESVTAKEEDVEDEAAFDYADEDAGEEKLSVIMRIFQC